ncbi:glutathione S-transferase family protein [Altererythrobacter sp. H2]|uniref:glutathione S-transferase family protein n=1 Tax=Altererythrobacter sp. H2 TaxID=3108391 RepID=UPI002B4BCF47|nr:glutathione S-transferase family protein [Altererythrobacter sp. H2]WRK97140.1 glutathione S-transferase family protein [Altererythrobacter sp. H2]
MAQFTFYTVAMSRGQIARWALHEAGADYDQVVFDWATRPAVLAELNPMNKVPTLVHHHGGHDHVVTECAAICHYLAETHPAAGLLPDAHEKASYFRWLFFAAGPLEQAVVAQSMGWEVPEGKSGMAGFGSLERTLDSLDAWFSTNDYVCGKRFTMADTYVGSQFIWGLRFGSIPERPAFRAYVERCTARPRYQEGLAVDAALIAEASGS